MEPMFVLEECYPSSSEENQTESVTNQVLQQPNIFAQLQDPAPRTINSSPIHRVHIHSSSLRME